MILSIYWIVFNLKLIKCEDRNSLVGFCSRLVRDKNKQEDGQACIDDIITRDGNNNH